MTLREAAERAGVSPDTLRRWARDGLIPQADGSWPPAAVAQARIVARLRDRGHTLDDIRRATESGQLAFGYIEDLFPGDQPVYSPEEAAADTGVGPALVQPVYITVG